MPVFIVVLEAADKELRIQRAELEVEAHDAQLASDVVRATFPHFRNENYRFVSVEQRLEAQPHERM